MSTINLANNRTFSSSKRTKHIKAGYFFIKDKMKEGKVEIRYCPTKKMWSNVLNKPKQGAPFRKDPAMMMDVPVEYDNNVKYFRTHPNLLPPEDKENLELDGSYKIPLSSSRSVLKNVRNQDKLLGVPVKNIHARKSVNKVNWSDMVHRNL